MRGIVELEVLRAIERQLPAGIPIRSFFDLIVGTRYVTLVFCIPGQQLRAFQNIDRAFKEHGITHGKYLSRLQG